MQALPGRKSVDVSPSVVTAATPQRAGAVYQPWQRTVDAGSTTQSADTA